jgi:lambda family phage portal protein
MNLIDKIVGAFSPEVGLKRIQARRQYNHMANRVKESKRGLDAAKSSPRSSAWNTSGSSVNMLLGSSMRVVRNRTRDLVSNNGYIKRAVKILTSNIVGIGIMPKFTDEKQAKLFREWSRLDCDAGGMMSFGAIQAQIVRAIWTDGEVLVRFRVRYPEDGLSVPLQLQVLEADYLDDYKTGFVDGGFCLCGIQFNKLGQRTGYWLFDSHPGESSLIGAAQTSRFVPASEVLHLFDPTGRPGQVRGISELAVSVWKARDLDDYQEAHSVRKKIEACFAAFVTSADDGFAAGVVKDGKGAERRIEELSPGLIQYLRQGEEITFSSPTGSDGYEEAVRVELRVIAAGTGVTYEQLTGDYSQVNFTSGRMGKMEFKQMVEQFQWLVFIPMFCDQVVKRFTQVAYLSGALNKPNKMAENWTAPRIPMLDPLREAQAYQVLGECNIMSRHEMIRELGYDPDEVDKEIESDSLKAAPASDKQQSERKKQREKTLSE